MSTEWNLLYYVEGVLAVHFDAKSQGWADTRFLPIRRYADIDLCRYADISDTDTAGKSNFF